MAVEITSRDNPVIKSVSALVNDSKRRRQKSAYVIEGVRLCMDALEHGVRIAAFFYTAECREKNPSAAGALCEAAAETYLISEDVAKKLTDTKNPQGFFCLCHMKEQPDPSSIIKNGRYAAFENIQDPSNLGTMLRTCEAFGFDGAILSSGCCDPYSPKVLRGAMGAVFRLPLYRTDDIVSLIRTCKSNGMRPLASVPDSQAVSITSVRFFRGVIMCIGNEGNGLSNELITACGEKITIPMAGHAESLNAATAAAILMWEMSRGK